MFSARRVRGRRRRAGVLARHARAPRGRRASRCPVALVSLSSATGAATAATSCTSGSSCCSSAWPRPRRSRPCATCRCSRARPRRSATRRSPTSSRRPKLVAAPNGRLERIEFGAELKVTRGGETKTLRTSKDYFPSRHGARARSGASSTASRPPRSRWTPACDKDIWAAVAPDIVKLRPESRRATSCSTKAADDLSPEEANQFLALALRGLTDRYAVDPPPARFRFEVNPLVTWIWLGALIVRVRRLHRRLAVTPARRTVAAPTTPPASVAKCANASPRKWRWS